MKKALHIIGFDHAGETNDVFYSYNPAKAANNDYSFCKATAQDVNQAVEKAAIAFAEYRKKTGQEKSNFLLAIAEGIASSGEELVAVCTSETALPAARIEGERMRTVNQLKMFATMLAEGSWVDARIDTAVPDRAPLPKPDIRFMHRPLGPVVVFGASNFPLAFSVAGGDTASALAAGCPVVVKAHPAHPATSYIIGTIIQDAASKTGMPDGVFSLLFDDGIVAGIELVKHPLVKAVGFTGSYKAGKALYDAAVNRPEPIPVYAEMGSTNPVFVLPNAMRERGEEIAAGYAAAVTMGVGQFCTNPGILIYQHQSDLFKTSIQAAFEKTNGGVMLTSNILSAYNVGLKRHLATPGVTQLVAAAVTGDDVSNTAIPVLLTAEEKIIHSHPHLTEEIFGPASMVVPVGTKAEMLKLAESLGGHLTATVHGTAEEISDYTDLLDILELKVGRLIINGFPTGVEVCPSMVHGGPFPATTDSKSTSVGTAAIYRFTRPVCYQNMPQQLLPAELQNTNSLNLARLVNGEKTANDIM